MVSRDGDVVSLKMYCEQHAKALDIPLQDGDVAQRIGHAFQLIVSFMKENNRMPTNEEHKKMGGTAAIGAYNLEKGDFSAQLAFLEYMLDFIRKNGRLPHVNEAPPDPF
jgi:hypothetical protein